ncbi:hypothetical protein, partial [Klebsiella pneumoniae]|uniref:hypothetical protein n=1 Tax=Klebsiella pneumoniae TaxID=573 RepID=UPI0038544D1B
GHAFNLAEPAQERKNFLAKLSMGLWRLDGMKQNATVPPGKIWPQVLIARLWVLALIGLSVARRQWKVLGLFALLYASILVPYVAG